MKYKNPYEKIEPGYGIPIEKPYKTKKPYNNDIKRQPQVMTKELSSLISLLSGCPKSKCSLFK